MAYDGRIMNVKAQVLISASDTYNEWLLGKTSGPDIEGLMVEAKANEDWVSISALALVIACIYATRQPNTPRVPMSQISTG